MRSPTLRRAVGFAAAALSIAPLASTIFGANTGCGYYGTAIWICLNPVTGKLDKETYDAENYANGEPDPCHCYDTCGPAPTCPEVVDAGLLPSSCNDGGDGG